MQLLHVDSGILGEASVSRRLSAAVVSEWRVQHPEDQVAYRDLVAQPLPHLTGELLAAAADPTQHAPEVQQAVAAGAQVLGEFLAADVIVVGAPMYNFGIPSQLKAWIDRLAIAGQTFAYTEQGPKGLAGGKTVIIASSRGGFYGADTPRAMIDHQERYLAAVFGFFGITDIRFVRAEGVRMGPEVRQASIDAAERGIVELVAA